jgi:hypothetical protein
MTPNCREVTRLTSQERDRVLPLGTQLKLALHRRFCRWCARYAKQLQFLHQASHLLPENSDRTEGPLLERDAKRRMKKALQTAANGE